MCRCSPEGSYVILSCLGDSPKVSALSEGNAEAGARNGPETDGFSHVSSCY